MLVEVWNRRDWVSWIIQENSSLDLLREGVLRWRKRKSTRRLIKYININYSAWRGKLKGFGNIYWGKVNRIHTSEGEGGNRLLSDSGRNKVRRVCGGG